MRKAVGMRWHVAQTQPNRESWAQQNLARQGFEAFYPQMCVMRRRQGRPASVLSPTFPGYIFVKFNPQRDRWRSINGTFGVRCLVGTDAARPDIVPDAIMRHLLGGSEEGAELFAQAEFSEGEKVCFVSGPLAGRLATVETLASGDRVRLLLEILGSARPVEASKGSLVTAD